MTELPKPKSTGGFPRPYGSPCRLLRGRGRYFCGFQNGFVFSLVPEFLGSLSLEKTMGGKLRAVIWPWHGRRARRPLFAVPHLAAVRPGPRELSPNFDTLFSLCGLVTQNVQGRALPKCNFEMAKPCHMAVARILLHPTSMIHGAVASYNPTLKLKPRELQFLPIRA